MNTDYIAAGLNTGMYLWVSTLIAGGLVVGIGYTYHIILKTENEKP